MSSSFHEKLLNICYLAINIYTQDHNYPKLFCLNSGHTFG